MRNRNFNITTHELAKICNVSQGTVDRALNERTGISAKTKEKILTTAKQYGYIENKDAKPQLIGIVLFDLYNDYFAQLIMDFENECKQAGYSLVVMFTDKDCEKEKQCIKQLYYMGVSGIILCPINSDVEFGNFLKSLKIPIITTGNKIDGVSYIGIDNFKAMYDATAYVGERYKNIVFYSPALKNQNNNFAQKERLSGFNAAAHDLKLKGRTAITLDDIRSITDNQKDIMVMCASDYYLTQVIANFPNMPVMGFDNVYSREFYGKDIPSVDSNTHKVAEKALYNIQNKCASEYIVEHRIIKSGL